MQFHLEKLDKNFVQLTATASSDEVNTALAEAYKRVVNKVNLPGFRKGHIPRLVLEAHFGKEILHEDAVNILVTKGYFEAVKEHQLEPIDQPNLELDKPIAENQPFTFKAKIQVLPEVQLGEYKGLQVEKPEVHVGDEQVEAQLKALQERHAELVLSDKQVLENGDFAVIDFEGYVDGKAFPGGAAQSYTLEIGSKSFIPGFEEQLIGMKVGAEKEIKVTFPADYQNKELAGREAEFKVALKEIKVKEIPEIDDEFAKSIGNFENVAQLKADLLEKLIHAAEHESEAKFSQEIIDKAVENAKVEIPEIMIERELEDLTQRFEQNLAYQGLSMDRYLEYAQKTREQVKEDFLPEARKRIKTDLVLNSVAKAEKITVSDAELDEKLHELAHIYQVKDPAAFRRDIEKKGRLGDIKQALLLEKTADFLKTQAIPKSIKK